MPVQTYKSEPLTDFGHAKNQQAMEQALAKVRSLWGQTYPLIIGGERIETADKTISSNPANPVEIIGQVSKATKPLIDRALDAGWKAWSEWKNVPGPKRSRY
ncbi:MAG: L-glutamate gamma-semialdehyde dehydrogenase, partial [Sulfobacillus sp.]